MANAPLVGQDGDSCAFDLPDEASEMFFAAGLDGWNRDEIAGEISLEERRKIRASGESFASLVVMPGLVPGIHAFA
jgi:hypothetical protein